MSHGCCVFPSQKSATCCLYVQRRCSLCTGLPEHVLYLPCCCWLTAQTAADKLWNTSTHTHTNTQLLTVCLAHTHTHRPEWRESRPPIWACCLNNNPRPFGWTGRYSWFHKLLSQVNLSLISYELLNTLNIYVHKLFITVLTSVTLSP